MALDATTAVLARHRPLDEAFEAHRDLAKLDERDRAFAFNLASTVLRRLEQLDDLVERCLTHSLAERLDPVRALLRIGAAQLMFSRTPAHAAVNTTVALARRGPARAHTALINAVLRRLSVDGPPWLAQQDAARLNTPEWLWQSWAAGYGEETARAIATRHLAEPPLDLTPRSADGGEQLASALEATRLPTGTLRLAHAGPVTALPGFDDGAWWVQDAAAALPARLLGDVAGRRVLDLCAAPGGKAAQLAAAGAHVSAVDRSPKRMARLADNLRRLGLSAELITADVASWRPAEPAPLVLLDAPCSSTGTIRRHPDIAHLKSPAEVAELAAVQRRLLLATIEMLTPGGIVVYCACSLEPSEGPELIDSLIADGAPVARMPIRADEIGGCAELLTSRGDLRTLPCHLAELGGLDGFYAARLQRR